jgi:hypothetical protein
MNTAAAKSNFTAGGKCSAALDFAQLTGATKTGIADKYLFNYNAGAVRSK